MKAVILAGGYGTRIKEMCADLPKPMLKLGEKPILLRQIETLKKEGIFDFVLITHFMHEKIEEYFGDGSDFGVNISYYYEEKPLGTAGALFRLGLNEDFLLCNGDLLFDFNLKKFSDFHKNNNSLITLFTHPSTHPFDSSLVVTDDDNRVKAIVKANENEYYQNLCNAGIELVSPEIFELVHFEEYADFDKDIVSGLIKTNRIFSYKSSEYVLDVGTPERLIKAELDIEKNAVGRKYSTLPQKAVFLDRDGTINVDKGYINDPEEIVLLNGSAEAINIFHELGFLIILITNQPVIARGDCSFEQLKIIHNKLEVELGKSGAYLDGIYFCPHHPDSGFDGEVKELKIACKCRKPEPGLILRAQKDFNIDLSVSYMVGDKMTDVQAAINAGCKPVLISQDNVTDSAEVYPSLIEFSKKISFE